MLCQASPPLKLHACLTQQRARLCPRPCATRSAVSLLLLEIPLDRSSCLQLRRHGLRRRPVPHCMTQAPGEVVKAHHQRRHLHPRSAHMLGCGSQIISLQLRGFGMHVWQTQFLQRSGEAAMAAGHVTPTAGSAAQRGAHRWSCMFAESSIWRGGWAFLSGSRSEALVCLWAPLLQSQLTWRMCGMCSSQESCQTLWTTIVCQGQIVQ